MCVRTDRLEYRRGTRDCMIASAGSHFRVAPHRIQEWRSLWELVTFSATWDELNPTHIKGRFYDLSCEGRSKLLRRKRILLSKLQLQKTVDVVSAGQQATLSSTYVRLSNSNKRPFILSSFASLHFPMISSTRCFFSKYTGERADE